MNYIDPATTQVLVDDLKASEDRARAFRASRAHRSAISDRERLRGLMPDGDAVFGDAAPAEIERGDSQAVLDNLDDIACGRVKPV